MNEMMGGGMMWGMGLWWILVVILLILGIAALAKYLFSRAVMFAGAWLISKEKNVMSYYFAQTLSASFDDVVARTVAALKEEGFGIITDDRPEGDLQAQARH